MPAGHNLPMAAVGGFILWFGWYGLTLAVHFRQWMLSALAV